MNDQNLLNALSELVKKERELLTEILKYLLMVESRKLYLTLGYSSMFKFCVDYLKYSDAEAQVRIQAMRLLRVLPEIEEKIESGSLSLTNAATLQNQFRKEAARRKDLKLQPIQTAQKFEIVCEMERASTRECERKLARIFPEIQAQGMEKIKAMANENTLVQFVAGPELMGKIEKLKGLLAHKNFEGRLDSLFEQLADIALKKLDPVQKESRRTTAATEVNNAPPPWAQNVELATGHT